MICFMLLVPVRLLVHTDHDGGRLDHGIGLAADLQTELFNRIHGDGGAHNVAGADVDLHDAVDGAFLDVNDGSLELISCTEFHMNNLLLIV